MVNPGSSGRGRIHPHQRGANITGMIIGDGIELDTQYMETLTETTSHSLSIDTKRGRM